MSEQTMPPNPFCIREYVFSLRGSGSAHFKIPCPGGKWPEPDQCEDLIKFMELIIKQIQRGIDERATPSPAPAEAQES